MQKLANFRFCISSVFFSRSNYFIGHHHKHILVHKRNLNFIIYFLRLTKGLDIISIENQYKPKQNLTFTKRHYKFHLHQNSNDPTIFFIRNVVTNSSTLGHASHVSTGGSDYSLTLSRHFLCSRTFKFNHVQKILSFHKQAVL